MTWPEDVIEMFGAWPLRRAHERQKLLDGDREYAARRYARLAADHGYRGPWRFWLRLQGLRGLQGSAILDDLDSEQLRYFALWALQGGEEEELGVESYERYLRKPGPFGPLVAGNCIYLDYLVRAGRGDDVLRVVDQLSAMQPVNPDEQMRAARVELARGQAAAALDRMTPFLELFHDNGDLWAFQAMLLDAAGREQEALHARDECRMLPVF